MEDSNLKSKSLNATKWSALTQLAVKIVSPITNMILARILAPEAFGVVVTITIITSFADMFADAGFQKYLIQKEFRNKTEKYRTANVAFLTNLSLSLVFWSIIVIFCDEIATLVGSPGLGNVVAIACIQLPITSLSSIQLALYQREFNFKTIFLVRIITVLVPFIVTIPLALLEYGYWSLIIGNIAMHILNALILTIKSEWKPSFFYSFKLFKEMFSFSMWTLLESISIWLTTWIDSFIISSLLTQHYLGIFKTSTTMVNALFALITASVVPVLFSTLSRLQNDNSEFTKTYLKVQRYVSILVIPLGVGVFLFSDFATLLLLGEQWLEASQVLGVWALTSSVMIVLGHFSSEAYRAKGKPKLSLIGQLLHLVVLIPTCYFSVKYGFYVFVQYRSWVRLQFIAVHLVLMHKFVGISSMKIITSVLPSFIAAAIMGIVGYCIIHINNGVLWNFVSIVLCIIVYGVVLSMFKSTRLDMKNIFSIFSKVVKKRMHR